MANFLLVCLGGGLGSGARYLVAMGLGGRGAWPWPTLAVNCLGSFFIELALAFVLGAAPLSETVRLGIATGFIGGFTTYSTFNHEVLSLFRSGQGAVAAAYLAATLVGAVLFGLAGLAAGRALWPG